MNAKKAAKLDMDDRAKILQYFTRPVNASGDVAVVGAPNSPHAGADSGRAYGYQLSPGGYRLFGHDASGEPAENLTHSQRFSAAQQMMLSPDMP